jgi:hypothetical protein
MTETRKNPVLLIGGNPLHLFNLSLTPKVPG